MRSTTVRIGLGIGCLTGTSFSSSTNHSASSPVVDTISSRIPGHALRGSIFSMIESGS
jgi:hypothetical protein